MKTFKQFLNEAPMAAPNAGGSAPAPSAAPTASGGASTALQNQSTNLGRQIQDVNTKLQRLMLQKAQVDKQISQASAATNPTNSVAANQATMAAVSPNPGA